MYDLNDENGKIRDKIGEKRWLELKNKNDSFIQMTIDEISEWRDITKLEAKRIYDIRYEEIKTEKEELKKNVIIEGLGTIYFEKSFENYDDNNSIISTIKNYIDNKKNIYLFGDSRKGKTHIACGIVKYICDNTDIYRYRDRSSSGKCFSIVKCVNIDIIISNYNDNKRMSKIDEIKNKKILIMDDIGVGKLTPERHSMYYYIIDHRICNGLQTIFTSNYKTTGLWNGSVDVEPTRLITRIQEMCEGVEIK
jgi:DNA replication protein DnaC